MWSRRTVGCAHGHSKAAPLNVRVEHPVIKGLQTESDPFKLLHMEYSGYCYMQDITSINIFRRVHVL